MSGEGVISIAKVRVHLRAPWQYRGSIEVILYNGVATITHTGLTMMLGGLPSPLVDTMREVPQAIVHDRRLWVIVRGYYVMSESEHILVANLRETVAALGRHSDDVSTARLFENTATGETLTWLVAIGQLTRDAVATAAIANAATKTIPATPALIHFFGATAAAPSNDSSNNNNDAAGDGGDDNRLLRKGELEEMLRAHFAEQAKQLYSSMHTAILNNTPRWQEHFARQEEVLHARFTQYEERVRAIVLDAVLQHPEHEQQIQERAAKMARERVDAFFTKAAKKRARKDRDVQEDQ